MGLCDGVCLVCVSSPSSTVVFNTVMLEVLTGLCVRRIVLLGDDLDRCRVQCRALERALEPWLGEVTCSCVVMSVEGVFDIKAVEEACRGFRVVVDLTPGRKLQALSLFGACSDKGWEPRYVLVVEESRFGYKLFSQASLDRFKVLKLSDNTVVGFKSVIPKCEARRPGSISMSVVEGFLNIALSGNSRVKVGELRGRVVLDALCDGSGACRIEKLELDEHGSVEWALRASGALPLENLDGAVREVSRALEEARPVLYDTCAYVNGVPMHIDSALKPHQRSLHRTLAIRSPTVLEELLGFENYKKTVPWKASSLLYGLWVWSKLTPGQPPWRIIKRGDEGVLSDLEEARRREGRAPLLVTVDGGLAARARAMGFDVALLTLPELRGELIVEKEALSKTIVLLAMTLPNTRVTVEKGLLGNQDLTLKFSPERASETLLLRGGWEQTMRVLGALEKTVTEEKKLVGEQR